MATLLRTAFAAFFIGLVSAVFAISFAAIIYAGPLNQFLDRGIGLTLMGCAAVALVGAFTLSYRGSILAAQDVPAILLAGAAASFVAQGQLAGEALFATVAGLVVVASLFTGLASYAVGRLGLTFVARYVPYPVLAGFLAATGLLLLIGGIGVGLGDAASGQGMAGYFAANAVLRWGPVVGFAIVLLILVRVFRGASTLPLGLIAMAGGFYLFYAAIGLNMAELRQSGFLLGPFHSGGFLSELRPDLVSHVDWGAILSQAPVILSVIASCLLGTTLNASGLELAVGRDFDIGREVKATGFANVVNACVGGLPGYHLLGESLLAYRLGITGALAGISSAAGCVALLLLGAEFLSYLPVGLFGAVIAFLGLDLIYTWLWEERTRFGWLDFGTVLLIPIIAVTFSFLTAIGVGLLIACAFFVLAYAKLDIIRSRSTLARRRSRMERPDTELRKLTEIGDQVVIIELAGYLFFGSASRLRDRVQELLATRSGPISRLIVDFEHVSGVDVSTQHVLQRISGDCVQKDVQLVLSGLSGPALDQMREAQTGRMVDTLDVALLEAEEHLLDEVGADPNLKMIGIMQQVEEMFDRPDLLKYVSLVTIAPGALLTSHDDTSEDLFLLMSGLLSVHLPREGGTLAQVAQIRAGAVVGEMAYYTEAGRSADIIAETECELLRVDMNKMPELESKHPDIAITFHKLIARSLARRLTRTTQLVRDLSA